MSISVDEINKALEWRYATKAYDATKQISDADWAVLEKAMHYAPASFGVQAHKAIVVKDPELRARLRDAAYGQKQVADASHFVVLAVKKEVGEADVDRYMERIVEVRSVERESLAQWEGMVRGKIEAMNAANEIVHWNARQAYISLGFLLEAAALLEIDATPMEGFDPAQFDEILGLTDYTSVVIAAVGYRNADEDWLAPLPKVRWKEEDFFDRR